MSIYRHVDSGIPEGHAEFDCPNCGRTVLSAGDGCTNCGYGYAEPCDECGKPTHSAGNVCKDVCKCSQT